MQPSIKHHLTYAVYSLYSILTIALTSTALGQVNGTSPMPGAPAAPMSASSVYTDREGGKHNWQINKSHALVWDGAPYLPVGGTFAPRSFAASGDASWQEDEQALSTLKARGLHDLIITPTQPLPDVPLSAMQRLIDYLESNGFHYGLGFGPGVNTPLSGMMIKPASNRYYEKDSLTATWQSPNVDVGLVVLVETTSGKNDIASLVTVRAQGDILTASLETPGNIGRVVALMYPHKTLPVGNEGVIPDVWAAYDSYRDHLISYLEKVKFGKGFRFFLDPLARHLSLADDTDYVIPDSAAFRLEWESYINRHYPDIEAAYKAWDVGEQSFKSTPELARLIPLWSNDSGAPYFFDPLSGKAIRVMDTRQSQWWNDFITCRNESLLYYMNALANVLKQNVANVPVVYTATHPNPIFWNTSHSGYDGLGIASALRGQALLARAAAPAYSEAEQAEHPVWCVATEIGPDAPTSAKDNLPPFASKGSLGETLELLRGTGVKGFFVSNFQSPAGAAHTKDWIASPDSLDWLREYAARLAGNAQTADFAPRVLYYPQNDPGPAQLGQIPGINALWLNSFQSGHSLDWWPSYSGYVLDQGENRSPITVLVSLQGKRETHLQVADAKQVQAFTPNGIPVPLKIIGKNTVIVTLDSTPTVFLAGAQTLVPLEAADDAIAQLDGLITYAKSVQYANADSSRGPLENALAHYRQKDYEAANILSRVELFKLVDDITPYVWIEGETAQPNTHTFDDKPINGSASGGRYLRLSNTNAPSKYGYGVHYPFHVFKEGRYNIWVAASAPGPETSSFQWALSDNLPRDPAGSAARNALYGNGRFGWILLGTANLKAGANTLALYVTDRASANQKYSFAIDSIFISTRSTPPDGTIKPLPVDPSSLPKKSKPTH